jgi:hypothetical protein
VKKMPKLMFWHFSIQNVKKKRWNWCSGVFLCKNVKKI